MYYHVGYDEVETDEALDLVRTLPAGSLFVSRVYPEKSWSEQRELAADIQDKMVELVFATRGIADAPHIVRPADVVATQRAREKAARAREKINQTNWTDTEGG